MREKRPTELPIRVRTLPVFLDRNKNATSDHPKRHTGNERRVQMSTTAIFCESCCQTVRPLPAGLLLVEHSLFSIAQLK